MDNALHFFRFFFPVLWVVVGLISNVKQKKYLNTIPFLLLSGLLYYLYHKEVSLFTLVISIFTCILIYIAFYEMDKFVIWKASKAKTERENEFKERLRNALLETKRETDLLNSDKTPTYKDMRLYYKMYLKKWEIDHEDEWVTDHIKPMSFHEWKITARRKTEILESPGRFKFMIKGGYKFIIPMTMDTMMGVHPNVTYSRYRDYKKMVERDEQTF